MVFHLAASLSVMASVMGQVTSDPLVRPDQWLRGPEDIDAPQLGAAIAMQDGLMAVSNGAGSVLLYTLDDGIWEYEDRLEPDTPSDGFGIALATDGTRVVVLDETSGPMVYRYNFLGSNWVSEIVEDLSGSGKIFTNVDFDGLTTGDDLVVCYEKTGVNRGFHSLNATVSFGTAIWSLSDTEIVGGTAYDYFGTSVDLDDGRLAVGNPPTSVVMYEEISAGTWAASGSMIPPIDMPGYFGQSVSLDGDYLAIGVPGTESDLVTDASEVAIYERDTWSTTWALIERIENPYAGDAFGTRVLLKDDTLLVSAPGRFTGFTFDPGRLVALRNEGGSWNEIAQFKGISSSSSRLYYQFGGPGMAFDDQTVVASSTGGQSIVNPLDFADGDVCVFNLDLEDSRFWQAAEETSIGSVNGWTSASGSRAIFSINNAPGHVVELDGSTEFEQIVIRDDTVLDLNNESSTFGNMFEADLSALRINGPSRFGMASATLVGPGTIDLENDLQLGVNGHKGTLVIDELSDLNVQGTLLMDESGTLDIKVSNNPLSTLSGVSLSGGLKVNLPDGVTPELGDIYTILEAGMTPSSGEDAFNLVSLPGLPGGLAFELSYGAGAAGGAWNVNIEVVSLSELLGFGDPESASVNPGALDLEVVDLNNDDLDELCVLFDGSPGQLAIFNMNTTGDIVQQIILSVGNNPVGLTSGDLDGDTLSTNDLAIAYSGQLIEVLGNSDNNFGNGFDVSAFSVGATPTSIPTCITAAQVDLTSSALELVVGFDHGDGTGAFTTYASTILLGGGLGEADNHNTSSPASHANPLDDEDKKVIPWGGTKEDGKVVVAERVSAVGPGLNMSYTSYNAANNLSDIALRDLDNDGDADIIVTSSSNNSLILLEQDSSGNFNAPVSIPAGTNPGRLTTADFDGDGKADIAALTTNANGTAVIRVFDNGGNFVFTSSDVGEGESPVLVDAGDVNGDGQVDLVSIASGTILLGGTPTLDVRALCSCIGDTDCSQQVDIEDLLNVLGEYGCMNDCQNDVNGDGQIDIEDLLDIISNWQSCGEAS